MTAFKLQGIGLASQVPVLVVTYYHGNRRCWGSQMGLYPAKWLASFCPFIKPPINVEHTQQKSKSTTNTPYKSSHTHTHTQLRPPKKRISAPTDSEEKEKSQRGVRGHHGELPLVGARRDDLRLAALGDLHQDLDVPPIDFRSIPESRRLRSHRFFAPRLGPVRVVRVRPPLGFEKRRAFYC